MIVLPMFHNQPQEGENHYRETRCMSEIIMQLYVYCETLGEASDYC